MQAYKQQQYSVVQMCIVLVGLKWGVGWQASWAVHGIGAWHGAWLTPFMCYCPMMDFRIDF